MADAPKLDLASLPPIFVLSANLPENEMHEAEDAVLEAGGQLSYNAEEARIFVGKISQKERAAFELRTKGVWTEETSLSGEPPSKKRRVAPARNDPQDGSGTEREDDSNVRPDNETSTIDLQNRVVVLKIDWLYKSLEAGRRLPYQPYLVYTGRTGSKPQDQAAKSTAPPGVVTYINATSDFLTASSTVTKASGSQESSVLSSTSIVEHTRTASKDSHQTPETAKWSPRRFRDQKHGNHTVLTATHPALKRATTSEHDFLTAHDSSLPPLPSWMLEPHPRANYSCLRSTFMPPVNQAFIEHLLKIKEARTLTLDEIGVRAYSTSIASLSAYPRSITYPSEIARLPGCSEKIATLWAEWYTSVPKEAADSERSLAVTKNLENDDDLKHLRLFYDIWGVGAETARKFYFDHGWRDLDDLVEYGWSTLTRVQQIGVKFYDEFLVKIPRKEVEEIADIVLYHARLSRDIPEGFWSNKENNHKGNRTKPDDGKADANWDPRDMVCVIVGGYRRGKSQCGDVDVILSHRNEEYTKDLIIDVVKSLEDAGHITHTLTLHTSNSDRDQQTLPYRSGHGGHGFDTLDKALCVWQDPNFDEEKHEKNPNIHRRVDIIISPWRTVGAAVLGWSGATTFERDIRVWCRKEHGWKFDSSGIRDRVSGAVLDLESPKTKRDGKLKEGEVADNGDGWEDRERRLMEGMGIGWRPATERCTG
ncbi:hypothetical protein LTR64_003646 [Lithohypha guttulata]|uniref:uncharacterized protein n=1 Tax=Lithohypha guttulata TaxID=1690604 RepID=UPI002DDF1024|nr:hypothetical protein LTR51_000133 [Lithohypha guttulata]